MWQSITRYGIKLNWEKIKFRNHVRKKCKNHDVMSCRVRFQNPIQN